MAMRGNGKSKTLFWCDSYLQTIESVVLASGERLSHITAKTHDFYINRPYRYRALRFMYVQGVPSGLRCSWVDL